MTRPAVVERFLIDDAFGPLAAAHARVIRLKGDRTAARHTGDTRLTAALDDSIAYLGRTLHDAQHPGKPGWLQAIEDRIDARAAA